MALQGFSLPAVAHFFSSVTCFFFVALFSRQTALLAGLSWQPIMHRSFFSVSPACIVNSWFPMHFHSFWWSGFFSSKLYEFCSILSILSLYNSAELRSAVTSGLRSVEFWLFWGYRRSSADPQCGKFRQSWDQSKRRNLRSAEFRRKRQTWDV